jgi:hypothetical protein
MSYSSDGCATSSASAAEGEGSRSDAVSTSIAPSIAGICRAAVQHKGHMGYMRQPKQQCQRGQLQRSSVHAMAPKNGRNLQCRHSHVYAMHTGSMRLESGRITAADLQTKADYQQ